MNWTEKSREGQTVLEEELPNIRKIETTYEGSTLKAIEFADKRGSKILRITGGSYGDAVRIWTPKVEEKEEE